VGIPAAFFIKYANLANLAGAQGPDKSLRRFRSTNANAWAATWKRRESKVATPELAFLPVP
jgi:hypothetical protein